MTQEREREQRPRSRELEEKLAGMDPEERKNYLAALQRFTGPITADVRSMSPEQRKRYERNLQLWPKYYAAEDPEEKKRILNEILGVSAEDKGRDARKQSKQLLRRALGV